MKIEFYQNYKQLNPLDYTRKQVEDMCKDAVRARKDMYDSMVSCVCDDVRSVIGKSMERYGYTELRVTCGFGDELFKLLGSKPADISAYSLDYMFNPYENRHVVRDSKRHSMSFVFSNNELKSSIQCRMYDNPENDEDVRVELDMFGPLDIRNESECGMVHEMTTLDFSDAMIKIFLNDALTYFRWIGQQVSLGWIYSMHIHYDEYKECDFTAAYNVARYESMLQTEFADKYIVMSTDNSHSEHRMCKCRTASGEYYINLLNADESWWCPASLMTKKELREECRKHIGKSPDKYVDGVPEGMAVVFGKDILELCGVPEYSDNPLRNKLYHDEIEHQRIKQMEKTKKNAV